VRAGRVPPVLRAHSQIAVVAALRIESTCVHDGEQARADRTRHAVAGGSPRARRRMRTGNQRAGCAGRSLASVGHDEGATSRCRADT